MSIGFHTEATGGARGTNPPENTRSLACSLQRMAVGAPHRLHLGRRGSISFKGNVRLFSGWETWQNSRHLLLEPESGSLADFHLFLSKQLTAVFCRLMTTWACISGNITSLLHDAAELGVLNVWYIHRQGEDKICDS